MRVLRSEPDLYDLPAWRQRLDDLLADPVEDRSDMLIEHARAHIAVLERVFAETPVQAR